MDHLESLVRWVLAYSVGGGFWHFIACWLILGTLTRVFSFVRVSVRPPEKPKSEP